MPTLNPQPAEPSWLTLGREFQAIAQIGLAFSQDPFDRQRYERIRELAASLLAQGAGLGDHAMLDYFRRESGYATPKVDVRAAAFLEGKVLLVREISDGAWTLPGGWGDVNQCARECVEREIQEESGFQARAIKLAAVWDYRRQRNVASHPYSIYKFFFICELTGGEARSSIENSAVEFFRRDQLPELSLGRVTPDQIGRMYEHRNNPELMTEFD